MTDRATLRADALHELQYWVASEGTRQSRFRVAVETAIAALLDAETGTGWQPIAPEWADAANLARGLCESEARRWESSSPKTAEHWRSVAVRLGALYLTQDHLVVPPGAEPGTEPTSKPCAPLLPNIKTRCPCGGPVGVLSTPPGPVAIGVCLQCGSAVDIHKTPPGAEPGTEPAQKGSC